MCVRLAHVPCKTRRSTRAGSDAANIIENAPPSDDPTIVADAASAASMTAADIVGPAFERGGVVGRDAVGEAGPAC